MKNYMIALGCLLPYLLYAQGGIVVEGANLNIVNGTDFRVESGGVINQAGGSIDNEGNLYLDNNWVQTASTYTGNGWMWYEGSTNQSINGAAVIPRLRVDNGNRLLLQSNINVTNELSLMNNGSILLGTNNVVISPTATITGFDASHYLITNSTGFLQRRVAGANVIFPIGNTNFNPATISNSGVADEFEVRLTEQVLDNGTAGPVITADVVGRTWLIEEQTVGGSDATVTLQWETPNELTAFDRNNCGVAHHIGGTLWDNPPVYSPATNVGVNTWTQTRSGFTSFSPFIVRDPEANDLPVELLSFEAERVTMNQVDLEWITATELNNDGFEVQRMLEGEQQFTKIGWVAGNGTTTNTSYYTFEDDNGFSGISYYRLKQIDFDGTFTYSDIRAVDGEEGEVLTIFPNPAVDLINIRLQKEDNTDLFIKVYDSKGALVINQQKVLYSNVVQLTEINELAAGVYWMQIATKDGNTYAKKFVKQRN
jgi:hypothetical protein